MSWGANAIGHVVFLVNVLAYVYGSGSTLFYPGDNPTKIDKIAIDWKTGSIVMVGGLIRNETAFNLGNFVYINPHHIIDKHPDQSY